MAPVTVEAARRRYLDHLVDQRQRERDERLERLGNPGAYHYRGRVVGEYRRPTSKWDRWMRTSIWRWEVINTATDIVVAQGGPYPSLEAAMTDCAKEVWMIRHAWTMGWLRKRYL